MHESLSSVGCDLRVWLLSSLVDNDWSGVSDRDY